MRGYGKVEGISKTPRELFQETIVNKNNRSVSRGRVEYFL
jgi:hypothetical protein